MGAPPLLFAERIEEPSLSTVLMYGHGDVVAGYGADVDRLCEAARWAEDHGAAIAFRSPLLAGHIRNGALELEVGGREPVRLLARAVDPARRAAT